MRWTLSPIMLVIILSQAGAAPPVDSTRVWEQRFRQIPETSRIREYAKRLSARPHHVGSAYDRENAEWMLSLFKQWGFDAYLEKFNVLFPSPKTRAVELVEPTKYVARLREPPVEVDPTSGQQEEQLPTYNAYSIDGNVTAPLVYVNYGIPDDYEQLERLGISVKGCIVIARYGASWRGIKPKVAAEHGAIGCLIYSDPWNDGFFQGDTFPVGPWRPPNGVQRGSVMDMPLYPGDPLTPGAGATPNAKRLPLKEAKTLTTIPVLPISYADAQPLLVALGGPVAPESWRGALPLTYHIGPGPARVHLAVQSNWDTKTVYDVIANIRGAEFPEEWILRGNHHDAWVNGTEDPVSGTSSLLEEARALGLLMKEGWKPSRTIVYCVWDGEEEGLLGSTEWAEAHAEELQRSAVLYINSDASGRGYLGMSGSHTLGSFVNSVARDIDDPETHLSVWKRLQLRRIADATSADERRNLRENPDLKISALGSGSDYTVFLDHLGIASLNLGYGGEDGGGIYHSIYDDYYWYTHFSDTAFVYGRALAQTVGTAVLRCADAGLLPFTFMTLADEVAKYLEELHKLAKTTRDDIVERNAELDEGVYAATADPWEVSIPPKKDPVPPFINFAPLENGVAALKHSANRYDRAAARFRDVGRSHPREVNTMLIKSERLLTNAGGLPNRPWFTHQIYAPGFYTGYGVKTLPAVREAMEQKLWPEAEHQIGQIGKLLEGEAALIDSAAAALEQITK